MQTVSSASTAGNFMHAAFSEKQRCKLDNFTHLHCKCVKLKKSPPVTANLEQTGVFACVNRTFY